MLKIRKNIVVGFLLTISILPIIYLFTLDSQNPKLEKNTVILNPKPKAEVMKGDKVNACFVVLIRNDDLKDWRLTMRQLEDRFNNKYNYPYVFLNDKPFDEDFKTYTRSLTNAEVEFGLIPKEHWSIPDYIDEAKAFKEMERMKNEGIIYGGSLSYRHMCR